MYFSAIWDMVNSIKSTCMSMFFPNLSLTPCIVEYDDVLWWTIIPACALEDL